MTLHEDYIIAEKANMIDRANFTKQIKCVFIGTNNYFFAIPYNMIDFRIGYTENTTETTDMYYEGMGLQEFLLEKVKEPGLLVQDFEQFVLNENFNDVQILNIDTDMNRFKVQASFWGSGVSYNKREGRVGWKPLVLGYKKEKKDIKAFYQNHLKCETK
jgi:hypothetical protein